VDGVAGLCNHEVGPLGAHGGEHGLDRLVGGHDVFDARRSGIEAHVEGVCRRPRRRHQHRRYRHLRGRRRQLVDHAVVGDVNADVILANARLDALVVNRRRCDRAALNLQVVGSTGEFLGPVHDGVEEAGADLIRIEGGVHLDRRAKAVNADGGAHVEAVVDRGFTAREAHEGSHGFCCCVCVFCMSASLG